MKQRYLSLLLVFVLILSAIVIVNESSTDLSVTNPREAAAQTGAWNTTTYAGTAVSGSGFPAGLSGSGTFDPGTGSGSFSANYAAGVTPPGRTAPTNYSVRWQPQGGTINFPAGSYRFTLSGVEDGARVIINGVTIAVNSDPAWTLGAFGITDRGGGIPAFSGSGTPVSLSGPAQVWVDAYNINGQTNVFVTWQKDLGDPWTVNYTNCTDGLQESTCTLPVLPSTTFPAGPILQNWGVNSPFTGVNLEHWQSVATRNVNFTAAGAVDFRVRADDIVRVQVSGGSLGTVTVIQSENFFKENFTYTGTVNIPAPGTYTITVRHADYEREAYLYVTWTGGGDSSGAGVIPGDGGSGGGGTPAPTGVTATANANVGLNVRTQPSTSATKIGVAQKGTVMPVTGRLADNSWVRVQFNDQVGWVIAEWVIITGDLNIVPIATGTETFGTPTPGPSPTAGVPGDAVMVARPVGNMRIRSGPGTNFPRIGLVPWGDEVAVFGQSADRLWIKITYNSPTGPITGWSIKIWYRERDNLFRQLPFDLPIVQ